MNQDDVWCVIKSMLDTDKKKYLIKHHIDSFNEFIHSKTNGIEYIIKRENPEIIFKEPIDIDNGVYRYEINIFYGETLDEKDGNINDKIIDFNMQRAREIEQELMELAE